MVEARSTVPKPKTAVLETTKIPVIFPSDEKTDSVNPWVRLFVIDRRTAGPGLIIATRAILKNNIQVESSINLPPILQSLECSCHYNK
jgi:hypothetical protein